MAGPVRWRRLSGTPTSAWEVIRGWNSGRQMCYFPAWNPSRSACCGVSRLVWPDPWCAGRWNGERANLWSADDKDREEDDSDADVERARRRARDTFGGSRSVDPDETSAAEASRAPRPNGYAGRGDAALTEPSRHRVDRFEVIERERRLTDRSPDSTVLQAQNDHPVAPSCRRSFNSLQKHHLRRPWSAWSRWYLPCLVVRHDSDQPMRCVPAVPDPCSGETATTASLCARRRRV